MKNIFSFSFSKRAYAPLYFHIVRHFAEIIDGITGLIMLPFNRYGTCFAGYLAEATLKWQMKNRKRLNKS